MRNLKKLVIAVAIIVGAVLILFPYQPEPKRVAKLAPKCTPRGALQHSQKAIINALISPSTAEFPRLGGQVEAQEYKPCHFNVFSYVDSQNEYGAMVRTKYVADVRMEPDGRWVTSDYFFP